MTAIKVRPVERRDYTPLLAMLVALWPEGTTRDHGRQIRSILDGKPRSTLPLTMFVAERDDAVIGFVEVGLRSHANGCDPVRAVGFIEGWYVMPRMRKQGVGRALFTAAEKWCKKHDCREMASDTWSDHRRSVQAHVALGYDVEGHFVNFRKKLGRLAVLMLAICLSAAIAAETQEPSYPRTAETPDAPKPAPSPASIAPLIGEYASQATATAPARHAIVFEKDGRGWITIDRAQPRPFPIASQDVWVYAQARAGAPSLLTGLFLPEGDFRRLEVGPQVSGQLQVTPTRDVAQILKESMMMTPPKETGDFKPADLVELATLDPAIKLDIRYATKNNFLGSVFYAQPRAFLQRPAADAVVRALQVLKPLGFGLLIHDGYRPWYVTTAFWIATPSEQKWLVANPASGSKHNRGAAVDLTLYDLKTGGVIEMPSTYDESTDRAYAFYPGGSSLQRWHRDLLRRTMEAEGFTVNPEEWWHFDYKDWKSYAIGNIAFDKIR